MSFARYIFCLAILATFKPSFVQAEVWRLQGIGNDIFQAHYTFGSGRFSVHCGYHRYLEIALLRQGLNGKVTFTFDQGKIETVDFSRSGFLAGALKGTRKTPMLNGSRNEELFYRILALLQTSDTVSIAGFGFKTGAIQTEGAKEILAYCRETDPVTLLPKG